jgi:Tfp pilus assembly protein PilF
MDPIGPPPETVALLTLDAPEDQPAIVTSVPQTLHRIAFGVLLLALLLAVMAPTAVAARDKRKPVPVVDAPVLPVAPPTPDALAMLDAAIADGRDADARNLIAPMWASGTPEVLLRGAELALAGGSLPEAAEAFTGLIDGPLAARARQGLGITLLRQGRDGEARTMLQQAVAADAGLARAWNALGVLADKAQDWPAADSAYAKAVAAAPQDGSILANRGWSQLLRGHHVAAERDLVAALKLQPGLKTARTNLALARAMQGRYQEAFVLSDKTTLASDLNTVGFAAMTRGDLAVAEAYFNRALSLNPQFDRTAWANLQYLAELKAQKLREPNAGPVAPQRPDGSLR